MHHKETIKD